jgi:hypothetical protein
MGSVAGKEGSLHSSPFAATGNSGDVRVHLLLVDLGGVAGGESSMPGATFEETTDYYFPATSEIAERGNKEDSKGAFASTTTTSAVLAPVALLRERSSWLEPYVMVWRYCRAYSDLCPRHRG